LDIAARRPELTIRIGPAALDVHSKKYPTILTPKDGGQMDRMIRPIRVIPCVVSCQRRKRDTWRLTIWIQIQVALHPVLELSQAKSNIATICKAYPPIGIALMSATENRLVPSAFFSAF
jgi:hypothetical protein